MKDKNLKKLPLSFYLRKEVVQIAKELLGKILVTHFPVTGTMGSRVITSGRIVECEAYNGIADRASHAYGGRRTRRNEIMYAAGGVAYVYLCYGIHHMFNVVTHTEGVPHAILIRAVEPLQGLHHMLMRTGKKIPESSKPDTLLTRGPGNLTRALGITVRHNGISLRDDFIYIADDGVQFADHEIAATARIGVDYAGSDARLPYRFYVKGNRYVSGHTKN